jgi:WD40 repeat protein
MEEEQVFRGHKSDVTALRTCGGRYLVSSDDDGTVRLWDLRSRSQLAMSEAWRL